MPTGAYPGTTVENLRRNYHEAVQTADALAGLFDAASQLVSALLDACRMPCCKNCDSDVREFDLDAVPAPIRKLLLDSGCCPSLLECYLEEGDVVYAAE